MAKMTKTQKFNALTMMRGKAFKLLEVGVLTVNDFSAIEKIFAKGKNRLK